MRGGSGSHSACLTASSSTCSGGSSRCGLSTTEGSVPVLHSYTVQFPRVCTNRSIGSTRSVGLQWGVPLTLLLPTCEARPRAGPGTQASRGESTSGEESAAGEVAPWSPPPSTGERPGPRYLSHTNPTQAWYRSMASPRAWAAAPISAS